MGPVRLQEVPMTAKRIAMHRLQELVRLHRMNTGARECARILGMSPNTERQYRQALQDAELLHGDPTTLPEVCDLQTAVTIALGTSKLPQQAASSVDD